MTNEGAFDLRRAGSTVGPFLFEAAPSLAWLDDTTLAVIDVHDQQVVALGLDGAEVARLGRKGGGPGEFTSASSLLAGAEGLLVAEAMRLSWFGHDLRLAGTALAPGVLMSVLGWEAGEVTALWAAPGPSGMEPTVGMVDLETGSSRALFAVYAADEELAVGLPMGAGTSPFVLATGAGQGEFVIGQPATYRLVRVSRDGGVLRTFGREGLEQEPPSAAERERQRRVFTRMLESSPVPVPEGAAAMVEQMLDAPRPYFRLGLVIDETGRLWVITGRGGDGGTDLDVFGADGRLVQTVWVPHVVKAVRPRLPFVAVLVELTDPEHEGQTAVHVYRLEEHGACADSLASGGP